MGISDPLDLHACALRCGLNPFKDCLISYRQAGHAALSQAYSTHRKTLKARLRDIVPKSHLLSVNVLYAAPSLLTAPGPCAMLGLCLR